MTARIVHELDLATLTLERGRHQPDGHYCVMEAVAYVAGEPWSDNPKCCSPVIGEFLRLWNDDLDDTDRQRLKPYIHRLVGTRGVRPAEQMRSWMCVDWIVRTHTPAWLDLAGLRDESAALQALPELQCPTDLDRAMPTISAARSKAAASWYATWDVGIATQVAVGAAAWDSVKAAAWSATRAAGWVARWATVQDIEWTDAWDTAWHAARAAARVAARRKLQTVVASLQHSACGLLDRMIECR